MYNHCIIEHAELVGSALVDTNVDLLLFSIYLLLFSIFNILFQQCYRQKNDTDHRHVFSLIRLIIYSVTVKFFVWSRKCIISPPPLHN